MASKAMIKKLNGQLNKEFYSSNLYLQMSAWCDTKGLEGSAAFLKTHADEESLFNSILDKLDLVGSENKQGLFFLDRELGQMVTTSAAE